MDEIEVVHIMEPVEYTYHETAYMDYVKGEFCPVVS